MQFSGDVYQELMERLTARLPDLAIQVQEEVARGRPIPSLSLSSSDKSERDLLMREAQVGRLGKGDVASAEYSDDEKLALALDAILRLASSMYRSREALVSFAQEYRVSPSLRLSAPGGASETTIELLAELSAASEMQESVLAKLGPIMSEVSTDS